MTQDSFGYTKPPSSNGRAMVPFTPTTTEPVGITLEAYAVAKRLPVNFLESLSIKNATYDFNPAIRIPTRTKKGRRCTTVTVCPSRQSPVSKPRPPL